ncbi:MAG: Crp/Fnr family transcriptional regulator [Halobacteriovoraceae bacterium]|nr:Crp/Fnr family transcriptional regulator [Halobacteriovoraceae bacterium]MCB9095825.1 Crp/Fnr family transcriptional regulator [Halobacteriovoraceae bacterium]
MNTIDALRSSQLFQFMDEAALNEIVKNSGIIEKFKRGKQLFFQGDKANGFYVVIEGKIQISRMSKEGVETILKNMNPGNTFAEVILFEKNDYPATALAIEDSIVFKVDKAEFLKLLKDQKMSESFILNLIKKLRFLTKCVELFNDGDVSDRFFHFIETHYGRNEEIVIREQKKEIANMIGTIPETFSRMLTKLKEDKKILSWKKNTLILKKGFWNELY